MKISSGAHFTLKTCSECSKKFFIRYNWRRITLGSPLIQCKHCGAISITKNRVEWYAYPNRWLMWAAPLVLCVVPGFISEQPGEAVFNIPNALTGLCFGLIVLGINLLHITKSKRRMKDPAYIQKLFEYGVITEFQRDYYLKRAK